jgi:hypothetical protein
MTLVVDYKVSLSVFTIGIVFFFPLASIVYGQSPDEYMGEDRILHNIAQDLDPDRIGFDIQYTLEGVLEQDVLIIELPSILIENPGVVFIDGIQETRAIVNSQGAFSTMYIPLFNGDKEITIIGTKVIPEFGPIVFAVLVISITTIITLTSRRNFNFFS